MTNSNASTVSGELERQAHAKHGRSTNKSLQQILGTIIEVHETLPMVRIEADDGHQIAGGDFISLGHSVLDILQRFGQPRNGLRVLVTYSGNVERECLATIIGVEGEKFGIELTQDNDIETSAWEIFTPGA